MRMKTGEINHEDASPSLPVHPGHGRPMVVGSPFHDRGRGAAAAAGADRRAVGQARAGQGHVPGLWLGVVPRRAQRAFVRRQRAGAHAGGLRGRHGAPPAGRQGPGAPVHDRVLHDVGLLSDSRRLGRVLPEELLLGGLALFRRRSVLQLPRGRGGVSVLGLLAGAGAVIQGHQAIKDRLNVIWVLALVTGGALGLRLVQLQILENVEYRLAAERNSSQIIYQTAPRGRIYDKDGNAVATNEPAFSLIYLPSPGKNKDKADLRPLARELGRQLKEDPDAVFEKLQEAVKEDTAIRLAENLPPQAMFRLSELKTIYPGVDLIVEARRFYPYGRFASHLIGYMGKMDPRSWKRLKNDGYRVDSRIGRLGIEGIFEKELRGRDGGIRMQVDAQGRLKKELERINWEAGSNIYLSIDSNIQKAADDALRTSKTGRGAAV